jgi:hypothetical protein
MPDTQRTLATVLSLLADNTTGAVSAQDLRDAIVSIVPQYGGVHLIANTVATSIGVAGTYVVTNWNTAGVAGTLKGFGSTSGGRLTYSGVAAVSAVIRCPLSVNIAAAAIKQLRFRLYKNGAALPGSEIQCRTSGVSGENVAFSVQARTTLATSDYLELWVTNLTDTQAVVLSHANLMVETSIG